MNECNAADSAGLFGVLYCDFADFSNVSFVIMVSEPGLAI